MCPTWPPRPVDRGRHGGGRLVWVQGLAPHSLLAQEAPRACRWRLLGNCLHLSVCPLLQLRTKTQLSRQRARPPLCSEQRPPSPPLAQGRGGRGGPCEAPHHSAWSCGLWRVCGTDVPVRLAHTLILGPDHGQDRLLVPEEVQSSGKGDGHLEVTSGQKPPHSCPQAERRQTSGW